MRAKRRDVVMIGGNGGGDEDVALAAAVAAVVPGALFTAGRVKMVFSLTSPGGGVAMGRRLA